MSRWSLLRRFVWIQNIGFVKFGSVRSTLFARAASLLWPGLDMSVWKSSSPPNVSRIDATRLASARFRVASEQVVKSSSLNIFLHFQKLSFR